ncbi:MAG: Tim44 domain-containing protein [Rhodospirillales bacterium]|nr:Tim44 domain-containing protein [Rhodospirillales bacterium]
MRSAAMVLALLLAMACIAAPGAQARAGSGFSMGSRGSRTFLAPSPTRTAPGYAPPLGGAPYAAGSAYPAANRGGTTFMHGFMGGLIGAGIGGLLLGHGLFWGMRGVGSLFGLLIQLLLILLLVGWLMRRLAAGGTSAGSEPMGGAAPRGPAAPALRRVPPPSNRTQLELLPEDFQQFEAALQRVQAAWSAGDLAALRQLATPDMAATFAQQLRDLQARGLRNEVSEVRLLQGDLAEAWRENRGDYATVAMRFSMVDVTRDAAGAVVDGAPGEHVQATEWWTFLRPPGGRWQLAAIQQEAPLNR